MPFNLLNFLIGRENAKKKGVDDKKTGRVGVIARVRRITRLPIDKLESVLSRASRPMD